MTWPNKIYVATTVNGVYYTDNFVDPAIQPIWSPVNAGLASLDCKEFHLDPFHQSDRQYVLLETGGLYRREYGGAWVEILSLAGFAALVTGGVTPTIGGFCCDPSIDGRIWVAGQCTTSNPWYFPVVVIYSSDYGATWTKVTDPYLGISTIDNQNIRAYGNNVYVVSYNRDNSWTGDRIYSSLNGGGTWTDNIQYCGYYCEALNPLEPTRVYCGHNNANNVAYLENGVGFTDKVTGVSIQGYGSIWFHPTDPLHQRIVKDFKLYVTTDGWTTKNSPSAISLNPMCISPYAGMDTDHMIVGMQTIHASGLFHIIGTLYGEGDVTTTGIAGTNCGTAPYTDSIPDTSLVPCRCGIQAVGKSTGIVHTHAVAMPGYAGNDRGIPMEGDRSVWDALHYPTRHTNDIDVGIHWTATELAALIAAGGGGGGGGKCSGNTYDAMVDGGLAGDGFTDDTVALQDLIDLATASGTKSATICFPEGIYLIAGALQDTGAFNGQILLPSVSTASKEITINFVGVARPPFEWVNGAGMPNPGGYSILKSTLVGASGNASCISGGNTDGAYNHFNNISVIVENLLCAAPDNPTFTFWNLKYTESGAFRNVQISCAGGWGGAPVQPTHSNAYGVKLPSKYYSCYTMTEGLSIGSFYTCLLDGEQTIHKGLIVSNAIVGLEYDETCYPSVILSMVGTCITYVIRATGSHYLDINNYVFEHLTAAGWMHTIYDIDDPSNYLKGHIRWMNAATGGAPDHSFIKNGGTGIFSEEMIDLLPDSGVAPATYGDGSHVPQIAVDKYGRITSAADIDLSAIASGMTDPIFQVEGALIVTPDVNGVYICPRDATIVAAYIYCRTPGSSSSTIVDVNLNGVTIFTTQANRPTLAWNDADQVAKSGIPDVTVLAENDVLSIDIDQVAPGAKDLTVIVALTVAAGGGALDQGVGLRLTASQSIPNSAPTPIAFSHEFYDTDSMHDNAVNNTRITIQHTGKYLITSHIIFDTNATGYRYLCLFMDGVGGISMWQTVMPAGQYNTIEFTKIYLLNAAQYLEIYVYQTSGVALDILAAFFDVQRLA